MSHCVADHSVAVALGVRYFYRMLRPERATIGLRRCCNQWFVSECRGAENRAIGDAASAQIRDWMKNATDRQAMAEAG
jgi:hypothetical protein